MLTVTDLFCGAGGSSIGAEAAGTELRMAANHWQLAVETHNTNFPNADHDCADVSQVRPSRYPHTDVLIASPECTNHSQAKTKRELATLFDPNGGDEAERSRATMMDVPRFAEHHRYRAIIVENVVEVRRWTGWDPWLQWMTNLGYDHELVYLNSMIAWPTPQSRDRLYVIFWRKGQRRPNLRFDPPSWCSKCAQLVYAVQAWKRPERPGGKYRQQYLYRCPSCSTAAWPLAFPAASAIDWTLPAERIGDRDKPLAEATRRRIEIGLTKFGPSLVQTRGHTFERDGYVRAWPVGAPSPTMTTEIAHGLAQPPMIVSTTWSGDADGKPPIPASEPFATQTGRRESGVAIPPAFYLKNNGGVDEAKYRAHEITEPFGAVTSAGDSHSIVTLPAERSFVTPLRSGRPRASEITQPLATVVADGSNHAVVTMPPFVTLLRGGGSRERSKPVQEPLDTLTASGTHHGLTIPPAFYVKNYGDGTDPSMAHEITEPLGAVTALDHHGLVAMPFTVDYHGNGSATPVVTPLPTQDTRDRHALVAEPAVTVDDCAFRMLSPDEIGNAMAFPESYVVLGNKRQRVRMYGNAVTPPVMQLLMTRVVESLA
jgi:DNA (cytosine-5)-methyltransferase 1